MTLLNLIKLIFQAVCNPADFRDSAKCREFVKHVLTFARSITEKNSIEIDEKILDQLDKIVASDELWKYCYTLVSCWFGAESDKGIEIDTDADGKPIFKPEGIASVTGIATIIPLLVQLWKIIRLLKNLKIEGDDNDTQE